MIPDREHLPVRPPPIPGMIRNDFDLEPHRLRSGKESKGLGLLLGIAMAASLVLSVALSALFWLLCVDPSPWINEHFFGQPLGYIEPFEAYSQIARAETELSESSEPEEAIELNAEPPEIWDQWVLAEYQAQTGNENPYSVFPLPQSEEELTKRRAAFKHFDETMETKREDIEAVVNLKIFFFDAALYFVLFSLVSSLFVLLVRQQSHDGLG